MFDTQKTHDEVNHLMKIGHYADAIPLLQALGTHFFEAQDWEKHAEYLNRCSECLWRLGDFIKSVSKAEQALEICKTHLEEGHVEVANSFNHLGICYLDFGNYPLSLQYHQQSLVIKQVLFGKLHPFVASSYNNIGLCYRAMDDLPQAIEYHYQALNIRQAVLGKEHILTARSLHNLGSCYDEMGETEKGTAYLNQALSIKLKELGDQHPQTAITLQILGVCFQRLFRYAEAIEVYQKVLNIKINTFGDKHSYTARTYFSLGYCYQHLGLYDEAMSAYGSAYTIWHQSFGEVNYNVSMIYAAYADVYVNKNNFPLTFHYLQKSLQSLNLPVSDTDIYPIPPLTNYIKPVQLLETLYGKSKALLKLYDESRHLCDLTASLAHFLSADTLIDQRRQNYKMEDSKHILAERAKKMVYDAGLAAIQIARNECLRLGNEIVHDAIQTYNNQYHYGLPATLDDLVFYFSEKSKSMLLYAAITDSKAKINANLPVEVEEEEQQLRTKLSLIEQQINAETGENKQQLDPSIPNHLQSEQFYLKNKYVTLIERLEKEYPEYFHLKYDLKVAGIGQIQTALPPKTALVSYVLSDDYLYTICITPTGHNWRQQKLPENFEYLAGDFTYTFDPFEKENYLQYGYDLYQILVKPLEENGILDNISRLVIIPDAGLSHIPFEAMLTQSSPSRQAYKDLPYLLHRYIISYHYSATLWLQQQKPISAKHKKTKLTPSANQNGHGLKGDFIGFAPIYSNNIPTSNQHDIDLTLEIDIYEKLGLKHPNEQHRIQYADMEGVLRGKIEGKDYVELLHSENEARKAGQLFADNGLMARILLHQSATLDKFKTLVGQYRYVLIAAHADVDDQQPERTGIIFSPNEADGKGIFYMGDAYNLRLQAEVVVLSCCETGLGKVKKGEGTLALNRGFLYSGAKNVVYTLFKVYDKESSQLTTGLFRHLIAGKSCATALHKAKLRLIRQGLMPIKWAGYVMVGE